MCSDLFSAAIRGRSSENCNIEEKGIHLLSRMQLKQIVNSTHEPVNFSRNMQENQFQGYNISTQENSVRWHQWPKGSRKKRRCHCQGRPRRAETWPYKAPVPFQPWNMCSHKGSWCVRCFEDSFQHGITRLALTQGSGVPGSNLSSNGHSWLPWTSIFSPVKRGSWVLHELMHVKCLIRRTEGHWVLGKLLLSCSVKRAREISCSRKRLWHEARALAKRIRKSGSWAPASLQVQAKLSWASMSCFQRP